MAEAAKQQGAPQQMDKPGGMAAGFNEIDQQQGEGDILGKVGMHPHGAQHGGVIPMPQRHFLAVAGANGTNAQQHEQQGEQGRVNRQYGHGICLLV